MSAQPVHRHESDQPRVEHSIGSISEALRGSRRAQGSPVNYVCLGLSCCIRGSASGCAAACRAAPPRSSSRVDSSKMRAKVWSLTHLPMRA